MGAYIGKQGLENLKKYHYVGTDKSLVAHYIMQPFWRWAVEFLPLNVAANLVTMVGFFFIIWSYLWVAYYAPTLTEPVPSWVMFNAAISLFIYQTMDALDGKQARRANCASPLGELTDHGCDALSTTMLALNIFAATRLTGWVAFYSATLILMAFYAAQWQEYHTDTLDLGYVGVTEGQLISMGIFIASGILGNEWWIQSVSVFGIPLQYNHIFVILSSVPTIVAVCANILEMIRFQTRKKQSLKAAALRLIPFVIPVVAYVIWGLGSRINVTSAYPHLFVGSFGLAVANMVSRMVLARVTSINFSAAQPLLFPLAATFVVALGLFPEFEWYFLVGYYAFVLWGYLFFAHCVVQEMTEYLGIGFLTIKRKPE